MSYATKPPYAYMAVMAMKGLTLEVMVSITYNQHMNFLPFTKQATFTPFAMDGIVGKVNINALLLQTVLF